jgi:hypothetical protein
VFAERPMIAADTDTALVPDPIVAGTHAAVAPDGKLVPYSKEHDLTSEPSGLTVPFNVAPVSVTPAGASTTTFGFGAAAFTVSNVKVDDSVVPPAFVAVSLNVYFVPTLSPVTAAETAAGLVPAGIVAGLHATVLPDGNVVPYSNEHDFTSEPSGLTVPFSLAPVSVMLSGASTTSFGFAPPPAVGSKVAVGDSLVPSALVASSLKVYFVPPLSPVRAADTGTGVFPDPAGSVAHDAVFPDGRLVPYSNVHLVTLAPSGLTVPFRVALVSVTLVGG